MKKAVFLLGEWAKVGKRGGFPNGHAIRNRKTAQ